MANIITHSQFLVTLLKNRPHNIGCEVGVHTGDTTSLLLKQLPKIEKYYAIDPWKSYTMYNGKQYRKPANKKYKTWSDAKIKFHETIKKWEKKVVVYQMTSVEACKLIDDFSLDWIFIDANHEYEYIKENLKLWHPKVKKGGIVSGHDYGNKWKGIKQAVDEFYTNNINIKPECYVWWVVK